MSTTTIHANAPRPATGDGDIVVTLVDNELTLSWKDGKLVDARLAMDNIVLDADGTTCECCVWKNGVEHCSPIRCGSTCP